MHKSAESAANVISEGRGLWVSGRSSSQKNRVERLSLRDNALISPNPLASW